MTFRLIPMCLLLLLFWLAGCQCSSSDPGDTDSDTDSDSDSDSDSECEWPESPECEDVDIQPVEPACSEDGWCWVHPVPAGNAFRTLWDDGCTLYAGGQEGALASVDLATGELIDFQNLYDDKDIYEITGFGDGRLVLYHGFSYNDGIDIWDGESLEELPMPEGDYFLEVRDVAVDLNGDLYVTGADYDEANQIWYGYFARWTGTVWERIETNLEHGLHEMAMEPCGGMYILGGRSHFLDAYDGGTGVFYWDGEELVREYWWSYGSNSFRDIDVGEDGAAWAAGEYDLVIRRQKEGTWERVFVPSPPANDSSERYNGVAVETDTSVVLGGINVVYWDGLEWHEIWGDFGNVSMPPKDGEYAGGYAWFGRTSGHLTKIDANNLSYEELIETGYISVHKVWVSPSNTVYISGVKYFEERPVILTVSSSGKLEEMSLPELQVKWLWKIWGTDDEDIWAVGPDGVVLHYDGVTWEKQTSPATTDLRAVWGASSDDVYFVGDDAIVHWNGVELSQVAAPAGSIVGGYQDIWGSDADNIYAITGSGGITHFDGVSWEVIVQPIYEGFFQIAGKGPNEMYIAGTSSVYSFDGVNIVDEQVGPYGEFESVAVEPGSGDVYVTCGTGSLGKVLRLTNGEWVLEDSGTFDPLRDIVFGDMSGFLAASGGLLEKRLQ